MHLSKIASKGVLKPSQKPFWAVLEGLVHPFGAAWADEQLGKAGQEEWLTQWRRRQWKWAATLRSKNAHKWSAIAARWNPEVHSTRPARRRQARPKQRWCEDLQTFVDHKHGKGNIRWEDLAVNAGKWEELTEAYTSFWSD